MAAGDDGAKVWGMRVLGLITLGGAMLYGLENGTPWVTKGEYAATLGVLQEKIAQHERTAAGVGLDLASLRQQLRELEGRVAANALAIARLEVETGARRR